MRGAPSYKIFSCLTRAEREHETKEPKTRRKAWYADSRRIKSMEFWPPGDQIFLWLVWDFEKSATILRQGSLKEKGNIRYRAYGENSNEAELPEVEHWKKLRQTYAFCSPIVDRFFVGNRILYGKSNFTV